jgi:hypothetical protein
MKRAKLEMSDGSILLLDTMCNAFGGIIFISFLLVVLINSTSATASKNTAGSQSQSQLIESETEREELTNRLASLQMAAEAQAEVTGVLVSKELLQNAARLKEQQVRHAQQVQAKSAVVGTNNHAEIKINQLATDNDAERQELEAERKKEAILKSKIAQAVDKKSRAATTPKMTRAGALQSVSYFLQHGKLFGPVFLSNGEPNTHDFVFTKSNDRITIDPVLDHGLQIADDGKDLPAIQQKLAAAKPGSNSVHLYIWEDSYRQFESLRVAFEGRGLAYAVIPWETGDRLAFTDEPQGRWEQQ